MSKDFAYAVVGATQNKDKWGYKIFKKLLKNGFTVYPVNPQAKEVAGLKCYSSVLEIPGEVDVLDLVTPPPATEQIVKQCLEKSITRVWFQPGAESETAIKFCAENNIKTVYNVCVMRDGALRHKSQDAADKIG